MKTIIKNLVFPEQKGDIYFDTSSSNSFRSKELKKFAKPVDTPVSI